MVLLGLGLLVLLHLFGVSLRELVDSVKHEKTVVSPYNCQLGRGEAEGEEERRGGKQEGGGEERGGGGGGGQGCMCRGGMTMGV